MVFEYFIQQKQNIYSSFLSSYGTLTKIDHILADSQSSPADGCFFMHQQSCHTEISDTCPSQGTPSPSGSFGALDRLWPAGQTCCPQSQGLGLVIQPQGWVSRQAHLTMPSSKGSWAGVGRPPPCWEVPCVLTFCSP